MKTPSVQYPSAFSDVDSPVRCDSSILTITSLNERIVSPDGLTWSGAAPNCILSLRPVRDAFGTTTVEVVGDDHQSGRSPTLVVTLQVRQLPDDSFTTTWTFDAADASDVYAFEPDKVAFQGGTVNLASIDQSDDADDSFGFDGGAKRGVLRDPAGYLRLGNSGGCDARVNNCLTLDTSWTPAYSSIIAYWPMDGTWNDAIGHNHGTPAGDAGFITDSKIGTHSATFDGDDSVAFAVPELQRLNFSSEYSIAGWIRIDPSFAAPDVMRPIRFQCNAGSLFEVWVRPSNDAPAGQLVHSRSNGTASTAVATGARAVETGWHHFLIARRAAGIRLILDGVQYGVAADVSTVATSCSSFSMGAGFKGELDEVALWNVMLAEPEARTLIEWQGAGLAGVHTSRVIDVGPAAPAPSWSSLSWLTTLPFGKELPDQRAGPIVSEQATQYYRFAHERDDRPLAPE